MHVSADAATRQAKAFPDILSMEQLDPAPQKCRS